MAFDPDHLVALARDLEQQYALRARHPERDAVYADYARRSERLRAATPGFRTIAYGASERCAIDWYPAASSSAAPVASTTTATTPLLVFIHGGFWRALDRHLFGFVAEHYLRAGVAVALIGYELAPQVTVTRIVEQVEDAMRRLFAEAGALGFDPDRVSVAGHSAGAHLSAMLASREPAAIAGHRLVSLVPISGVFALEPLLLTSVNLDVRMTPDEAVRMSPSRRTAFHCQRFLLPVGSLETDGFVGQSRDFDATLRRLGVESSLMIVPERTHFDILEDFSRPGDALFRATLDAIHGRSPAIDTSLAA